ASSTSSEVKRFPIRPASDGPNAGRLLASDAQLGGATAGYQEIRDMVLASNGTDLYVLAGNDGTSKPRIGWLRSQGNALSAIATYPDDSDPLTSAIVSASALSNLRHATR